MRRTATIWAVERVAFLTSVACMVLGCDDALVTETGPAIPDAPVVVMSPSLDRCDLDPQAPTRLVVTTTDFSTGAVTVADLATGQIEPDVALATTDTIPVFTGGALHLVHRFGHDFIEPLSTPRWQSLGQYPLAEPGAAPPNPHAVARGPQGLLYVTMFGRPEIRILDTTAPPTGAAIGGIGLGPIADDDGNPDAGPTVVCGDTLVVAAARLDLGFSRRDFDELILIDLPSRSIIDVDPSTPGAQGYRLAGGWAKQLRRDPADPQGQTLLVLTTGIERVSLATGEVSWAVDEATFAAAGVESHQQPQAFDVDAEGTAAYVAAYAADFSQVSLSRVGLDAGTPMDTFATGFDSVERTLEVVDGILWYGSTRLGAPGLWSFDLDTDPPTAREATPRPTGLPPYAVVAIP